MKNMEMFVLEIGNQECLPWLMIITQRKQKNILDKLMLNNECDFYTMIYYIFLFVFFFISLKLQNL